LEGINLPIVTLFCLVVGKVIKQSPINSKWIPLICLVMGGILGIAGYLYVPEWHLDNPVIAVITGIISGAAATGLHQAGTIKANEG
jgi:hypothetical protein